jgi:hypothetical protein
VSDVSSPVKPLLVVVHDDEALRELLAAELHKRFGQQYDVEDNGSAEPALAAVRRHVDGGKPVAAAFSADSSVCGGSAFRTELRDLDPNVRRVLILGRGEWSSAHPAVTEMRTGQAESYSSCHGARPASRCA